MKRVAVGYIHCCAGLRKSKSYSVVPEKGYVTAELDYLEICPVCGHTVVQLTRVGFDNNISVCRKINAKAKNFFDKMQSSILFEREIAETKLKIHSKFYLYYNEYGVKKKCYSNLSTLKMGLFENKELVKQQKQIDYDKLELKNIFRPTILN